MSMHTPRVKLVTSLLVMVICFALPSYVNGQETTKAYDYDVRFVERITFLNETGIVSIDYEEPWWFEMYQYADSLENAVYAQLDLAQRECTSFTSLLGSNENIQAGAKLQKLLRSLHVDGQIDHARFLSSLLQKFTVNSGVDAENSASQGRYKPLVGQCDSSGDVRSGLLLQMFPELEADPTPVDASFCRRVVTVATCLENLQLLAAENDKRPATASMGEVDLSEQTVFGLGIGSVDR